MLRSITKPPTDLLSLCRKGAPHAGHRAPFPEVAPAVVSPTLQPVKPRDSASVRHNGTFGIGGTSQVPASVPRVDGRSDEYQTAQRDDTVNSSGVASSSHHNGVTSVGMPVPRSASPSNICSHSKGRSPVRLTRSITNGSHICSTR